MYAQLDLKATSFDDGRYENIENEQTTKFAEQAIALKCITQSSALTHFANQI